MSNAPLSSPILVTGAAGFIGYHLCQGLLAAGHTVVGLDNLNDYYDIDLKNSRLDLLQAKENFDFAKIDLQDKEALLNLFKTHQFDHVVNLAAQAGVRYSLDHPEAYIDSNITGFLNVLEACRAHPVQHLIYASSSSVYGLNKEMPFNTDQKTDTPLSLYAASKKANELMAHSYASLFKIPCTGLRFFTVYGPWGRPDMALYKFSDLIYQGQPIEIYNKGDMMRDFTYIDDIVTPIIKLIGMDAPTGDVPTELYNIGGGNPKNLMDVITMLEEQLGMEADKKFLPMQPGDVKETSADTKKLADKTGYTPQTSIEQGLGNFVDWYKEYKDTDEHQATLQAQQ